MLVSKSFFQRIPFIRISSLFLMGVLVNHSLPIDFNWTGFVLAVLISCLIFMWHFKHLAGEKTQNLLISLCILLSGIFYPDKFNDKASPIFEKKDYFLAEICQRPVEKAHTYQSILWIQNRALPKAEKTIAYFSKEDFDTTLVAGDQLLILAQPGEIKNSGNPFEFDYRAMMHNKGIEFTVYLPPDSYKKTGLKIRRLSYFAEHVRDKLVRLLAATNIQKEERSVVSALTLGYRAELDPQTRDTFAATGTMHVLAVSGLHVGLIYLIFSFLFSGINRGKFGSMVYPVAMILFLWTYAFITGFSPSVQRATVMFTFVIVGQILRRPVNIYNSLAASALVLILHEPNVIFEVGFQLSYLAVFGIVLLQPPIASLMELKNKILKWLWALLTVSIAAQLITFPLGILYFNQFPNYFWISNFFVIPGAMCIIWLTFSFFAFSPFPLIPEILAKIIQFTTHLMLDSIKWVSALPHAVSEGMVLNSVQVCMIYGMIFAFVIYGFSKNKTHLFGAFVLLISFQISNLWLKYDLFNQKAVYVYNSKNPIIHLINGRSNYVVLIGKHSISDQEYKVIQNVCNHLKLEKPHFCDPKTINKINAPDLKVNEQSIRFLNCQINFTDQLKFNVQGTDLIKFKSHNPNLAQKQNINTTNSGQNSYLKTRQAFSLDFTTQYKEVVVLSLN